MTNGPASRWPRRPPGMWRARETALIRWLNGGPAKPTATAPRPFQRGVDGRPTLVQNVETLARIAQIARFGAEWFRQTGTAQEPGTMYVTVSGAVAQPGVFDVPIGIPIEAVLARAGGASEPLQALLMGGFFGTWIPFQEGRDAAYSRAGLSELGASPGAGIVVALPAGACGLVESARLLRWFAAESAGQCGPCVFGLADVARTTAAVAAGRARGRRRRPPAPVDGPDRGPWRLPPSGRGRAAAAKRARRVRGRPRAPPGREPVPGGRPPRPGRSPPPSRTGDERAIAYPAGRPG